MSLGYVHLFALPPVTADSETVGVPQYQFTFNSGGNAYSRVLKGDEALIEFLGEEIGLRADVLKSAVDELRSVGKTTIADVDVSENEAAALGLQEVGVDY